MIQSENPVSRASHAFDDYRRAILLHLDPAARAEYPLRQGCGDPTRCSAALDGGRPERQRREVAVKRQLQQLVMPGR